MAGTFSKPHRKSVITATEWLDIARLIADSGLAELLPSHRDGGFLSGQVADPDEFNYIFSRLRAWMLRNGAALQGEHRTATITIGGTVEAGDERSLDVAAPVGFAAGYITQASDTTNSDIATHWATAINGDATAQIYMMATATANVVTIEWLVGLEAVTWSTSVIDAGTLDATAVLAEVVSGDLYVRTADDDIGGAGLLIGSDTPESGGVSDVRMFFDVSKGAFRAGSASAIEWNDVNRGANSAAFGTDCAATATDSLAGGNSCLAQGERSFSFGHGATAQDNDSVALGGSATAIAVAAIAVGNGALAGGVDAIALGGSAAIGVSAISGGAGAQASADNSIAWGNGAQASSIHALALGRDAIAGGAHGTAIGHAANAAADCVALGTSALAFGPRSTAIGDGSRSIGDDSTAIGRTCLASGAGSVALGTNAEATSTGGLVISAGDTATSVGATATAAGIAIGVSDGNAASQALVTATNGIAIGRGCTAETTGLATGVYARCHQAGQEAFAGSPILTTPFPAIADRGASQIGRLHKTSQTSGAVSAVLGGGVYTVAVPVGRSVWVEGIVYACITDPTGPTTTQTAWTASFGARNVGGVIALASGASIASPAGDALPGGVSIATPPTVVAGGIAVTVTGALSHDINWTSRFRLTEIIIP